MDINTIHKAQGQSRINLQQREKFLNLLEANMSILFASSKRSTAKSEKWDEIAKIVNKLGNKKTVDQWRTTWSDLKKTAKRRLTELNMINEYALNKEKTYKAKKLSEEDIQILRICDPLNMCPLNDAVFAEGSLSTINTPSWPQITSVQCEHLLTLLEDNLLVIFGPDTIRRLQKWIIIADKLNALGPKKSTQLWQAEWHNIKIAVKRKVVRLNASLDSEPLNYQDFRVMRICEAGKNVDHPHVPYRDDELLHTTFDEISEQGNLALNGLKITSVQSLAGTCEDDIKQGNLKWMNHSENVVGFRKLLRNETESCDITLAFKNKAVKAHRFVLSTCSTLLGEILRDIPAGAEATIVVPDIDGELLDSVLNFIYMGETNIPSPRLGDFLEAIENLGIKNSISFECAQESSTVIPKMEPVPSAEEEEVQIEDQAMEEGCIELAIDTLAEKNTSSCSYAVKKEKGKIMVVDPALISQHTLVEDSSDEELMASNRSSEDRYKALTPTTNSESFDDFEENLLIEIPTLEKREFLTDESVDKRKQLKRPRIKKESSEDDDSIDESNEPKTFREQVDQFRAKQKRMLKKQLRKESKRQIPAPNPYSKIYNPRKSKTMG